MKVSFPGYKGGQLLTICHVQAQLLNEIRMKMLQTEQISSRRLLRRECKYLQKSPDKKQQNYQSSQF